MKSMQALYEQDPSSHNRKLLAYYTKIYEGHKLRKKLYDNNHDLMKKDLRNSYLMRIKYWLGVNYSFVEYGRLTTIVNVVNIVNEPLKNVYNV